MSLGILIWDSHLFSDISDKIQLKIGTKMQRELSLLILFTVFLTIFRTSLYCIPSIMALKSEESTQVYLFQIIIAHNLFAIGKINAI